VFERHGHRQIGDGGTILGQREQFGHAFVDAFDVVAVIFGQTIEGDMFAGVVDFLLHEGANLGLELRIGPVAMSLHRFDEEGFAARKGGRQGIVPGGAERIAGPPPARCRIAIEAFVADGDGKVFRRGRGIADVGGNGNGGVHGKLRGVN